MRSAIPMLSKRSTGLDNAACIDGLREWRPAPPAALLVAVANRPAEVATPSTATQTLTPRQPMREPAQAASGTPISRLSDCPLITHPKARPCWVADTRWETSVKIGPVKTPQQPPESAAHTAAVTKLSALATPVKAPARATGPPIRKGHLPQRSDAAPAPIDARPHAIEVMASKLAISGTLLDKSRAMSIRNGARVMPVADAVNMPSDAAIRSGQGMLSRVYAGDDKELRFRLAKEGTPTQGYGEGLPKRSAAVNGLRHRWPHE